MRIAIDARMMGPENTRGIGRYTEELIKALLEVCDHEFVLIVRRLENTPFLSHPRVEHLVADVPHYSLREQLEMPRHYREARADLVHAPHWNVPLAYRGPLVVTVHDLILRHQPTSAKASTLNPLAFVFKNFGYRAVLWDVMRKAGVVCVPTQWVASDIQKYYRVPSDKLVVTGEGIPVLPAPDFEGVPENNFLFYVGAAYPHKRLDLLLEGWLEIAKRYPELSLVIAGEKDVFMRRLMEQARATSLGRVTYPGRVSDARLAAYYQRASMCVFPSSDEGFGLPPLEALSQKCPVVSSDASCLPEVLSGPGVKFFRNGDVGGMIEAIDTVLKSSTARADAERSWEALKVRHSWKKTAEQTLAAYAQVVH